MLRRFPQKAACYAGREGAPDGECFDRKNGHRGGWGAGSWDPLPVFALKKAALPLRGSWTAQAMGGTGRRGARVAFQAPTSWNWKLTGQLFSNSACRLQWGTPAVLLAALCIAFGVMLQASSVSVSDLDARAQRGPFFRESLHFFRESFIAERTFAQAYLSPPFHPRRHVLIHLSPPDTPRRHVFHPRSPPNTCVSQSGFGH